MVEHSQASPEDRLEDAVQRVDAVEARAGSSLRVTAKPVSRCRSSSFPCRPPCTPSRSDTDESRETDEPSVKSRMLSVLDLRASESTQEVRKFSSGQEVRLWKGRVNQLAVPTILEIQEKGGKTVESCAPSNRSEQPISKRC